MGDIDRKPTAQSIHNVHTHICPECKRPYTCACAANSEKESLVCRDCEQGVKRQ